MQVLGRYFTIQLQYNQSTQAKYDAYYPIFLIMIPIIRLHATWKPVLGKVTHYYPAYFS